MSAVSKFARAVSLRDKTRSRSRGRDAGMGLFTVVEDGRRKPSKDEAAKTLEIQQELAALGRHGVADARVEFALRSRFAGGSTKEAMRLLLLYDDAVAGVLCPYNPKVKMLGAENRDKTTCWLDSLLFAMFARTDVFEAVLHHQYEDEDRRRMVDALRLWVNMLRSGKLITTDIVSVLSESADKTQQLQLAIAECGWEEAARPRQQDASEAFNFITDKLQLPLLTLKTDIYHQGKEDANDDHKFITERMLDVAIPENLPQGAVLRLESCLEDYFNNRVEVKRHLARRLTVDSAVSDPSEKSGAIQVETVEVDSRTSSPAPSEDSPRKPPPRPLHLRNRTMSIFSDRKATVADSDNKDPKTKKEVLMPAWQFLNLIPWYTDNMPETDAQVRSLFSHRPLMLGICLKRYGITQGGASYRRATHVDIPLEMASPHFTTGDADIDGHGTDARDFKLVLQSFVCHRGHSVDAGHYIAFIRCEGRARIARSASDVDADADEAPADVWLKFDDLAGTRVAEVDIHKALLDESPYLLFYRVQPLDGAAASDPDDSPPPYSASEASLDYVDVKLATLEAWRAGGGAAAGIANGSANGTAALLPDTSNSTRPSIEITGPPDEAALGTGLADRGRAATSIAASGASITTASVTTSGDSRRASQVSQALASPQLRPVSGLVDYEPASTTLSTTSTRGTSPAVATSAPLRILSKTSRDLSRPSRDLVRDARPASAVIADADGTGRRLSASLAKLRLGGGKEKAAAADVTVREIGPAGGPDLPPLSAHDEQDETPTLKKGGRKKFKTTLKRRGSGNGLGNGASTLHTDDARRLQKPDRECSVM